MDNILQIVFSWQFILFSLMISAIVFVIKKIIDFTFHVKITGKESPIWKKLFHIWDELIVQLLPLTIGGFATLIKQYPYPDAITSGWGRFAFGLVAGMFSGFIYRLAKSFITKFISVAQADEKSEDELIEKVRDTINKE